MASHSSDLQGRRVVSTIGNRGMVYVEIVSQEGSTLAHGYRAKCTSTFGSCVYVGDKQFIVVDVDRYNDRCCDCVSLTVKETGAQYLAMGERYKAGWE